jgi:hypothetical protein
MDGLIGLSLLAHASGSGDQAGVIVFAVLGAAIPLVPFGGREGAFDRRLVRGGGQRFSLARTSGCWAARSFDSLGSVLRSYSSQSALDRGCTARQSPCRMAVQPPVPSTGTRAVAADARRLFSDQGGQDRDAVDIGGRSRAGYLSDRRQDVREVAQMIGHLARRDLARPVGDERDPQPPSYRLPFRPRYSTPVCGCLLAPWMPRGCSGEAK